MTQSLSHQLPIGSASLSKPDLKCEHHHQSSKRTVSTQQLDCNRTSLATNQGPNLSPHSRIGYDEARGSLGAILACIDVEGVSTGTPGSTCPSIRARHARHPSTKSGATFIGTYQGPRSTSGLPTRCSLRHWCLHKSQSEMQQGRYASRETKLLTFA